MTALDAAVAIRIAYQHPSWCFGPSVAAGWLLMVVKILPHKLRIRHRDLSAAGVVQEWTIFRPLTFEDHSRVVITSSRLTGLFQHWWSVSDQASGKVMLD